MCTHLHTDHVGWNTRLRDGRWVPTFPNARYLFARREFEHRRSAFELDPGSQYNAYADSVLPVIEAGQADLVDGVHALADVLRIEPAPGHTPGHSSYVLSSKGQNALIWGDIVHSHAVFFVND